MEAEGSSNSLKVPALADHAFKIAEDAQKPDGKRSIEREVGTGLKDKMKQEQERFETMKQEIATEQERRRSTDAARTSLDQRRKSLERINKAQAQQEEELTGEAFIYDPKFHVGILQNVARHWTQTRSVVADKEKVYDVTGGKREVIFDMREVYDIKRKEYPRHAFCFSVKVHPPAVGSPVASRQTKWAFGFDDKFFYEKLLERITANKRSHSSH